MIWMIFIKILKNTIQILIAFDDMIADMFSNRKLNPIVTELFIRETKLNIFLVLKNVTLNSTHYFVMEIPSKRELKQIALNHSSDIDFKDFMSIYKNSTAKPYSFLVIYTTLA